MRLVLLIAVAACGRLEFDERPPDSLLPIDAPTAINGPGTWTAIPAAPLPPTVWTRSVWTGRELAVFGGALDPQYNATDEGARFDPDAGTWTAMARTGAPSMRHSIIATRLGDRMFLYGGASALQTVSEGGIYDPVSDGWAAVPTGPVGLRIYSEAHAIGARLLLWGGLEVFGNHYQSGFIYDPAAGSWTAMSTVGAPSARSFASSVWTGDKLIVWGGCSGGMPQCATMHGDGAIYDPALDTWAPMSMTNAPTPREAHSAVWTGSEMIVFGGATTQLDGTPVNTGAVYTLATDTWRPISTVDAPGPRADHAAVWLGGTKMLVWGSLTGFSDGFLYDPALDAWSKISSAGAPSNRQRFAYATDDRRLFVFGGSYSEATGAFWSPEE